MDSSTCIFTPDSRKSVMTSRTASAKDPPTASSRPTMVMLVSPRATADVAKHRATRARIDLLVSLRLYVYIVLYAHQQHA